MINSEIVLTTHQDWF